MIREHVVETLEWDVAFANEYEAFDWQSRLASTIRGPAVDVISEVFDELGGASTVFTLDTLEIDLGRLSPEDFESQLRERLRACLREKLADELGRQSQDVALVTAVERSVAIEEEAASRLGRNEVLQHYLAQGFLPWQAGSATRRTLAQFAQQLAADKPHELRAMLADAPNAARARLNALLSDSLVAARRRVDVALFADGSIDASMRDAWLHLLRWDGDWLTDRVQHHGQSASVRRHMALHFTRELLLGYVGLVVPTERDFIASVIGEAALFGRAMDPPVPPAHMEPRLWEFTLAYLIVDRGSEFNRRSYIASLLRRGAEREGVAYEVLLGGLMRALRNAGSATSGLQREMLSLLQAIAQEELPESAVLIESVVSSAAEDSRDEARAVESGWLKLRIESALLADVSIDTALRRAWSSLVDTESDWLAAAVSRLGQAARVRERMVRHFNDAMLFDVVTLVVPTERGFIEGVIGESQRFGEAMDPPVPAPQMRLELWEFSLAYLLVERGSGFNRRSYLESLLRQAARRDDVGYHQLLASLVASIERAGAPSGLQREMLVLLQTLRAHAEPEAARAMQIESVRAVAGTRRWRDVELPKLRFEWQAALAAGFGHRLVSSFSGPRGGADALRVWRELAQQDTTWLLDVTASAAQSERTRRMLVEELPQPMLVEWLDLMTPGAGAFIEAVVDHASELQRASSAPATRTRLWEFSIAWLLAERGSEFNRRSYMRAVLQRMAREEGRDASELLSALVAGLRAAPSTGAMHRQLLNLAEDLSQDERAPANRATREADGYIDADLLITALRDGTLPSSWMSSPLSSSPREVVQQIERWLDALSGSSASSAGPLVASSSSQFLSSSRAALEHALRSPQAVTRAIALLSPRLLVRIVALLRRTEHAAVMQCADAIARAAVAIGNAATRSRIETLKWQFILRYLFVQGRRFNAADFARSFADFLATSLRIDQPQRWRASLADGIARNASGVSQTMVITISSSITATKPAAQKPMPPASKAGKKTQPPTETPLEEPIYIANAGVVLAEPFLPHLFRMRGLMEDNAFKDEIAAAKAAHLIQAVAYGPKEWREWQEHELVLNKLLCGLELADALAWHGELDAEDFSTVNGMVEAMKTQWTSLGGTSVDGLRETFLRREGRLVRKPEHWNLLVQPGPYDMLVDQVPWGFSTARYPWMKGMIHVQWR